MNKRSLSAILIIFLCVVVVATVFSVSGEGAIAAEPGAVGYVDSIVFSVTSNHTEGAILSTSDTLTFDLALPATGSTSVSFSYYEADTVNIDVSALNNTAWHNMDKNADNLSASRSFSFVAATNRYYFFRSQRTVSQGTARITYTYYYSNSGTTACVINESIQNGASSFYYLAGGVLTDYASASHASYVRGYELTVSDPDTDYITAISATHVTSDGVVAYDTSEVGSSYTDSDVTFTVNPLSMPSSSKRYYYAFGSIEGVGESAVFQNASGWQLMSSNVLVINRTLMGATDTIDTVVCFQTRTDTGVVLGDVTDGADTFGDENKTHNPSTPEEYQETIIYLKWSTSSPTFGVTQHYTDRNTNASVAYEIGTWANNSVTYVLELSKIGYGQDVTFHWYATSIAEGAGGVVYGNGEGGIIGRYVAAESKYYDADGYEVAGIGVEKIVLTSTQTLRFYATTRVAGGTGGTYYRHNTNFRTNIDVDTPDLIVTARDYAGNDFAASDSGDIYAVDNLRFTLVNSNRYFLSSAQAHYQYVDAAVAGVANAEEIEERDWQSIAGVQNQDSLLYQITKSANGANEYFDGTYYFRIISGAGLSSAVIKIDFSIDSSDYFFRMDENDLTFVTTEDGWAHEDNENASEGIKVYLEVKERGIYSFYYTVASRNGFEGELQVGEPTTKTDALGETIYVYTGRLKDGIVNGTFRFYAKNRAGVVSESVYELTDTISIDSFAANVSITGTIVNSSTIIAEGDWVNGQVNLALISNKVNNDDNINVSGYTVYQVIGTTEILLSPELDGRYLLSNLSSTDTYRFKFVTGAGVVSYKTYRLNIESADIDIADGGLLIYVADENGIFDMETPYTVAGIREISVATKLKFVFTLSTAHIAPYNIYFRNLRGGNYTEYILGSENSTNGEFILDLAKLTDAGSVYLGADEGYSYTGQGVFNFYFLLESAAVDFQGIRNQSSEREVELSVNRQTANITLQRTDSTVGWLKNVLSLLIANRSDYDGLSFTYQISYGTIEGPGSWSTIRTEDFYSITTESGYKVYTYLLTNHFNGYVYIRALNAAGYVGGTPYVRMNVAYDNTTPNAMRAIEMTVNAQNGTDNALNVLGSGDSTKGSVSLNASTGEITVYSSRQVRLVAPTELNSQYAPTLFFAYMGGGVPSDAPTVDLDINGNLIYSNANLWRCLNEVAYDFTINGNLTGNVVYMYASNYNRNGGIVKVTVYLDNSQPTFEVRQPEGAGGISGESGVWVYKWSTANEIYFRAPATTNVYYQVNIDGTWYELNATRDVNGVVQPMNGSEEYTYTFNASTLYSLMQKRSVQATVSFRVVTLTGATAVSATSVRLQVDTESPVFGLSIRSGEEVFSASNWDNSRWVANMLSFTIVPADAEANPGGVEYSYRFGASDRQNPLENLTFTSNFINGLVYQETSRGQISSGSGVLTVYAVAKATGEAYSVTITINIDALEPEFDVAAYYYNAASQQVAVNSGDWINVNEITLELANIGKKQVGTVTYSNVSDVLVTYVMSTGDQTYTYNNQSFSINEKTKLTFTATSRSGLSVTKVFEVNIDTQAPVVVSRITQGATAPNIYYVDERISWLHDEDTIKVSTLNGVQFSRGDVVSTETINVYKYMDTPNPADPMYGYCVLYLEDMAGNHTTLTFYMRPFVLTVDNIELTAEHEALLADFLVSINKSSQSYQEGGTTYYSKALTEVRETYFRKEYTRLVKRLNVLSGQIENYQNYLKSIAGNNANTFTLQADYPIVSARIAEYDGYATWERNAILEGSFIAGSGTEFVYRNVYNVLVDAYDKLKVKMANVITVQNTVTLLPATMVVEISDWDDIVKAYDAYLSLTADQKSVFAPNLYQKLIATKSKCEALKLADAVTGVSISGDKLATDIRLNVQSTEKTTDRYIGIQNAVYEAIPTTGARSIVAVYTLSLSGENAANTTGTVRINLTIPDGTDDAGVAYRNYTAFAVYKYLDADGTILTMKDVQISADGKFVYFETDSLGTYALASNSNVIAKAEGEKVYARIEDIVIDGTMIMYISIAAGVVFFILIIVVIITGIRRRRFLDRYDKKHRYGLAAAGISAVPKGNPKRRRNPLKPDEYSHPRTSGTQPSLNSKQDVKKK